MVIFKKLVVCGLLCLLPLAAASEVNLTALTEGHGATAQAAISDALKEAIQQVVGVYVQSSMEVSNGELIRDRQIAFSAGAVKRYSVVGIYKDHDGVFVAKVRAVVDGSRVESIVVPKIADGKISGETLGQRILLERGELRARDSLFKQAFDNFYAKMVDLSPISLTAEPTRGAEVFLDLDLKATIDANAVRSLESILHVIAKDDSWGAPGEDIVIRKLWGGARVDFGDPVLTGKITDVCVSSARVELEFLSADGELIAKKVVPFNKWNLFRCGPSYGVRDGQTRMLIWANHSETLKLRINLPVKDVQKIASVKAFID